MTNSACCLFPMMITERTMTKGFGQKASAAASATAITAKSSRIAAVARHADRRVRRCSSSLGSALRKSSLNSSPVMSLRRSPVDAADQHVLHFEKLFETVLRAFAAQARLLDPAERRHLSGDDAGVGADDADLHLLGDPEDTPDVAAVEVARQAELGVVRKAGRIGFGLEADQRRHRPEGFLPRHDHLRRDLDEDRGLVKQPAALMRLASDFFF